MPVNRDHLHIFIFDWSTMVSTKVMRQYWCFFVIFISYFYSIHKTCQQEAYTNTYKNNKCTKQRNDCVHISSLLLRLLIIFTFFFTHSLLFSCSYSLSLISIFLLLFPSLSSWANTKTEAPPLVVRPVPSVTGYSYLQTKALFTYFTIANTNQKMNQNQMKNEEMSYKVNTSTLLKNIFF